MISFRNRKRLPLFGGVVFAVMALSAYVSFGARLPGVAHRGAPPSAPRTAAAPAAAATQRPLQVALSQSAQPSTSRQPAAGAPPAASSPATSSPAGPSAAAPESPAGRNPFVPVVRPTTAPRTGLARPLSPRAGVPSFGVDLPLPPGFTPAGQAAPPPPPPPPGAGMTVGAIAGGSERVAIIRKQDRVFVVGVGDKVDDAVVVDIKDNKVVMRQGRQTFELTYGGGAP